jgi:cytochrome c oxidase subunit 2
MLGFPSPGNASTFTDQWNWLFLVLVGLSLLIAVPIFLLLLYFSARYHRGARTYRQRPPYPEVQIELAWIGVPVVLALLVFAWAAYQYVNMYQPPANAMAIDVIGKQWFWEFQHQEGRRELAELHVPVGRPIRLTLTSEDVIHSFYVPAFRVHQDAVPGRYTTIWFQATETGEFRLNCTEYCGLDHALMGGKVYVMTEADYERWLGGANATGLASTGEQLFRQYGCSGCHKMEGGGVGPSLAGIYGKQVPLFDGTFVTADDRYIHDSILLPKLQIAAGYPPVMPSFRGQLSEGEIFSLIAYIKSLGLAP